MPGIRRHGGIGAYGLGSAPVAGDAEAEAVFHAATYDPDTYELKQQLVGEGVPTCTHTADILRKDHENMYRTFGEDEVVWEGARAEDTGDGTYKYYANDVVSPLNHQLLAWYKLDETTGIRTDIHNNKQLTVAQGTVGSEAGKVGLSANFDGASYLLGSNPVAHTPAYFSISFWFKVTDNSILQFLIDSTGAAKDVYLQGSKVFIRLAGSAISSITPAVNNEWMHVVGVTDGVENRLYINGVNEVSSEVSSAGWDGADLYVGARESIVSFTTGAIDELAFWARPLTQSDIDLLYNGGNGVTYQEGVGAPLPEQPWMVYQPAATNELTYSNDLTNTGAWGVVGSPHIATFDQIGLTGETNTATYLEDASTNGFQRLQTIAIPADANPYTAVFWIKKDSVIRTGFPDIGLDLLNGTRQYLYVGIDPSTGEVVQRASLGTTNYTIVEDGDHWKLILQVNNANNTQANIRINPAYSSTLGGSLDAPVVGSMIISNAEVHANKTIPEVRGLSPIFTTTAAASTDETVYEFDYANHSNIEGAYFCDMMNSIASGEGGSQGVPIGVQPISNPSGWVLNDANVISTIYSRNLSGVAGVALTYTIDEIYKIAAVYGDSKSTVNANNIYGDEIAFSGFAGTSSLQISSQSKTAPPYRIRNIQRYDLPYDEGKAKIDELMINYVTWGDFTEAVTWDGEDITWS